MTAGTTSGQAFGKSGKVYRLLSKLGGRANGDSAVFEAISPDDRMVAIKVVREHGGNSSQSWKARWTREKQIVLELQPTGTVRGIDVVTSAKWGEDSFQHGYVMHRHRTLAQYLKSEHNGSLTETQCVRLAIQLTECLLNLHEFRDSPLLHRDIKPDNLLWNDESGSLLLADPGIIREVTSALLEEHSTREEIIGSPGFMAPEQCGSGDAHCFATDIFGIGCTLYYLLADKTPFPRDYHRFDPQQAQRELLDSYPAVGIREHRPDISVHLEAVIKMCLQKKVEDRYQTCSQLLEEFTRLRDGRNVQAPGVTLYEKAHRVVTKHPKVSLSIFVLSVLSLVAVVLYHKNVQLAVATVESTNSLMRVHLSNAERLIEENDLLAAIPDVVAASQLDSVEHKDIYDRRIGTLLHYAPRLKECWSRSGTQDLQYLPQSQSLVAFNCEGMQTLSAHGELSQTKVPSFEIDKHEVVDAFVSPGERFFVAKSSGGHIHVVDRGSGEPLNIAALNGEVTSIQISNSDISLAVGLSTGDVALWPDLHSFTPEPQFVLKHTMPVTAMAFSPDGTRLAVGTGSSKPSENREAPGGFCCLWRVIDGAKIGDDLPHEDDVVALVFRPDGKWISTGTWTGVQQVWDGINGRSMNARGLRMHGRISSAEFSPDSSQLATSAVDGTVSVNRFTGEYAELREFRHESDVVDISFLMDNSLVTAGRDRRVKVWSPYFEQRTACLIPVAHTLQSLTPCRQSQVATAETSGIIKLWQPFEVAPSSSLRVRHGEFVRQLGDDKIVVTSGANQSSNRGGEVYCVDTAARSVVARLTCIGQRIEDVAVAPKQSVFAVLTTDGELKAWKWAENITEIAVSTEPNIDQLVGCLQSGELAIITDDGEIRVLKRTESEFHDDRSIDGERCVKRMASLHNDALFCVSEDKDLQLWDLVKMAKISSLQVPVGFNCGTEENPLVAAISPDHSLVCLSSGSDLWIWQPTQQKCHRLNSVHSMPITSISFSPGGESFAVSSRDHSVSVWNSSDLQMSSLLHHKDEVNQVVFSPSGRLLASVDGSSSTGNRGMARVWETRTGIAVSPWLPHENDVYGVTFGEKESEIWTSSWDGIVRRWVLPTIDLTASQRLDVAACLSGELVSRSGRRSLTSDEVSVSWNRTRSFLDTFWSSQALIERESHWLPPGSPDPVAIHQEAIEDAQSGDFRLAMEKHLWFHQHATRLRPSLSGVRLSFALHDWLELGKRYPPARSRLIEAKDDACDQVFEGDDYVHAFNDFSAINRVLGNDIETARVFATLDSLSPDRARRVASMAREALLRTGAVHLCAKYTVAKSEYATLVRRHKQLLSGPPDVVTASLAQRKLTKEVSTLVAILALVSRNAEAEEIAAMAQSDFDDQELRNAVTEALKGVLPPQ